MPGPRHRPLRPPSMRLVAPTDPIVIAAAPATFLVVLGVLLAALLPAQGAPRLQAANPALSPSQATEDGAGPADDADPCLPAVWTTPVLAPVTDPFRPPANPYGPGNRGIEYGTETGDPVRAAADGQVGFVGAVGGRRYVVIRHDADLRATYGPLRGASVVPGQHVSVGELVGEAVPGFHLTARIGDRYVDPAPLLSERCVAVRLVPVPPRASLRRIDG